MAKGFYLTIGVDTVNSSFYTAAPLSGCVPDAKDYAAIAESKGFQKPRNFAGQKFASIFDQDATRDRILDEIKDVAAQMTSGDIFFLHYSGHGMPTKDFVAAQDNDTLWCAFDMPLPDKFLFDAWFAFPDQSRVLLISDSCHSGTVLRSVSKRDLGGRDNQRATRAANAGGFAQLEKDIASVTAARQGQTPGAGVLLLAGCQDDELSGDLGTNGRFTAGLKQVWNNGAFKGDYRKFHQDIADLVSQADPTQNPNRAQVGNPKVVGDFPFQNPFEI